MLDPNGPPRTVVSIAGARALGDAASAMACSTYLMYSSPLVQITSSSIRIDTSTCAAAVVSLAIDADGDVETKDASTSLLRPFSSMYLAITRAPHTSHSPWSVCTPSNANSGPNASRIASNVASIPSATSLSTLVNASTYVTLAPVNENPSTSASYASFAFARIFLVTNPTSVRTPSFCSLSGPNIWQYVITDAISSLAIASSTAARTMSSHCFLYASIASRCCRDSFSLLLLLLLLLVVGFRRSSSAAASASVEPPSSSSFSSSGSESRNWLTHPTAAPRSPASSARFTPSTLRFRSSIVSIRLNTSRTLDCRTSKLLILLETRAAIVAVSVVFSLSDDMPAIAERIDDSTDPSGSRVFRIPSSTDAPDVRMSSSSSRSISRSASTASCSC